MKYIIILLAIFCGVACSKSEPSTNNSSPQQLDTPEIPAPIPTSISAWSTREFQGLGIKAEIKELNKHARETLRNELKAVRIEPVTLTSAQAVRLLNTPLYERAVFIVPKLFVQSGLFGGRVTTSRAMAGKMTMRFPIALVDGLKPTVISGLSSIPLPEHLKLQDDARLREELQTQLGYIPTIRPLPGCLENIVIEFGNEKLPVVPVLPKGICPINQIFEAIVTADESTIRQLIEEDMITGNVHLIGSLDNSASFVSKIRNIEISSRLLRERLYKHFVELPHGIGANDFLLYPAADVRHGIEKSLTDLIASVGIPPVDSIDSAATVDNILISYFEYENCQESGNPCFRYRTQPLLDEPTIYLDSYVLDRVPLNETLALTASLISLSSDHGIFVLPGEATDDANPPERGRRGGLLRPIREGDLAEIRITNIIATRREYLEPIRDSRLSSITEECLAWGTPPEKDEIDYSLCLQWNTACAKTRVVCTREETYCMQDHEECVDRGVGLCFFCCNRVERICDRSSTRCATTEVRCDEYARTSCAKYGTKKVPAGPAPCLKKITKKQIIWRLEDFSQFVPTVMQPSEVDNLTLQNGINLMFSHWEPGPTGRFSLVRTTCPLSAFHPSITIENNNFRIRFRVENNKEVECTPFNSWNRKTGREPELTLVNKLDQPATFACGFREEYYERLGVVSPSEAPVPTPQDTLIRTLYSCPTTGEASIRPIFTTYHPRFDIKGTLSLPGVRFTTQKGNN